MKGLRTARVFVLRRRRRGIVFVIVLWISLGLVSLALYFGQSARWAAEASENSFGGIQAQQAIEGARRYIAYVLDNLVTPGQRPDVANGDYLDEDVPVDQSHFWIVGRDNNADVYPTAPVFGLVDEASKLNLNSATQEMLEALPNMNSNLAAAIIDWRDADSELTQGGAESPDYEALDTPYTAKNGDFESVAELRLVMGMDLSLLWGEDVNRNGVLDPNENDGDKSWPDDNADGKLDPGLAEYVTVWSREPNTRSDGSPRVNLQGATAGSDLRQLLNDTFGASRSDEIMQRLGGNLRRLTSPLEFYLESGLTSDEYGRIENDLTVSSGSYRVGLVNAVTASATVLECLPGMDVSKAQALVGARQNLDSTQLQSLAWVTTVLDPATIALVGPYLTAQSYQFSADIVAVGPNGRGLRRSFMVFDHESDTTKLIYRRDRTRMGWPLGTTPRNETQPSTSLASLTGNR